MSGSDLIVEIPWLFFGLSLAAICLRIRGPRGLRFGRSRGPRSRGSRGLRGRPSAPQPRQPGLGPPAPGQPGPGHADGAVTPAAEPARSDQFEAGEP